MRLKNTRVKIIHQQIRGSMITVKLVALKKAGRCLKPVTHFKHLKQAFFPCFFPCLRYTLERTTAEQLTWHCLDVDCARRPVRTPFIYFASHYRFCLHTCVWRSWKGPPGQQTTHVENVNSALEPAPPRLQKEARKLPSKRNGCKSRAK